MARRCLRLWAQRPKKSGYCSAISHLSLVLACDHVTHVCHCMGAPSCSLALMKEQKSLEAVVPKCPCSSIKAVPALTPPGSSQAANTTACHADCCSLATPRLAIQVYGCLLASTHPGAPGTPRPPPRNHLQQGLVVVGGYVTPPGLVPETSFLKETLWRSRWRPTSFLIPSMSLWAQQSQPAGWTPLCLAPCT